MRFITIKDLQNDLISNLSKIPHDIDLVVGVPRSGVLVAVMIALQLNLPVTDLDSYIDGKMFSMGKTKQKEDWIDGVDSAKKVLIVEDSVCNGNSILMVKEKLKTIKRNHIYLAAYVTPEKKELVDFYFDVVSFPRLFEWNYMHNKLVSNACFDLDGVLCEDPTNLENDDGENYISFLKNAKLKYKPTFKIGCIITSRLEKYREETVFWLKNNGIEYDQLIMSNHSSSEERRAANDYASFKATHFKKNKNAYWFVESNPLQAQEIASISGKPVFCVDNQTYYNGGLKSSLAIDLRVNTKRKLRSFLGKFIPKKIKDKLRKRNKK